MMNALNSTELYVLEWLILCYVSFTSIKRKGHFCLIVRIFMRPNLGEHGTG